MNFEEFNIFGKKINLRKIIKELAKIGLILLILFSIFLLNHSVLLSPDDYNYSFVQGTNLTEKVDSLEKCIRTGKYFYQNWTGRVLPHVLIGIFRNINPIIYEIVNTVIFMIFICLIPKVLNKKSSFLSILCVFGYFAFSKMFGEKFAWISGSFNYLWPTTMLLILIHYFYNYYIGEKSLNTLSKIALILYSFIVGFMHENTSFVGGAFLICLILFKIKDFLKFEKNKKIVISLVIIMFGIGAILNIFAPGNLSRMNEVSNKENSFWDFLDNYSLNIIPISVVIISMIAVYLLKEKNLVKEEILHFILPALIATIPMAVIGYFPPRAFLAYELMFVIVLAKNVIVISKYYEEKDILIAIISIALTLIIFGKYSPSTLAQINYIIPYKNKVTAQYEEAKQKGEKDVLVSKFEFSQWIHIEDYINIHNFFPEFEAKMPINQLISSYYGFDRVTAIGEDEFLIEITLDTEGINAYNVINKNTNEIEIEMEYDNKIRYVIPKEEFGNYVLDCRDNDVSDKILDFSVRSIEENITDQININYIIIK